MTVSCTIINMADMPAYIPTGPVAIGYFTVSYTHKVGEVLAIGLRWIDNSVPVTIMSNANMPTFQSPISGSVLAGNE